MAYNKELRQKTKEDFVKYLEEHPDERFWQAVRNFSGMSYILACDRRGNFTDGMFDGEWIDPVDTYYWEGKNE